jgi:hypothetical protein
MLSTPVQADVIVSQVSYNCGVHFHTDQIATSPPSKQSKKQNGKGANASRKIKRAKYWWPVPNGILTTERPARLYLFTDSRVQAWVKFKSLVSQWRAERGATSSITKAAMCDAYQKIIGMGPDAIPLIIAQIRSEGDEPDQWFWALQVLTGVDPVEDEDRGDFAKMAGAWIEWAETEGYAG